MALEALTEHIEVCGRRGEAVPDPSSLNDAMSNPRFRYRVAFLVSIREREKTARVA